MRTTRHSRQHGSQLVEFALVLPLLLILTLMVSEGSGMIRAHQVLNNSAREGARLATLEHNKPPAACDPLQGCTCDATCIQALLKQAVVDYGVRNGLSACGGDRTTSCFKLDDVTIEQNCQLPLNSTSALTCDSAMGCPAPPCVGASRASAQYTYEFSFLPKFISTETSITLHAESVFRNLY